MRIIVTDTAFIWNHANPILEQFKDIILVVCLEGKRVSDQYECFVSPYLLWRHNEMGIDKFGIESKKYKALEYVADDLKHALGYHDKILFLTDGNPESLYPFYVIKDKNHFNSLHLCTVSPWKFESDRRIKAHKELLSDLSQLESILYINSNDYLRKLDKQVIMEELMQQVSDDFAALLPRVLNGIQNMKERSYFDFASRSYVPIDKGFGCIDLTKAVNEVSEINVPLYREWSIPGKIIPPKYPREDDRTKEVIEKFNTPDDVEKAVEWLKDTLQIEPEVFTYYVFSHTTKKPKGNPKLQIPKFLMKTEEDSR
ncbi:MAG: hypothetical protein K2H91_14630 [Lachnospiraceae bacterium]|nr:hypothetical protein [Lachnospiraceae bacterium]